MSENLASLKSDKIVDARAMACPGPLLEAKKSIASVTVGQILEIQSADQGSREDIPAWCKKTGHEYLGHLEKDGFDALFVRRKK